MPSQLAAMEVGQALVMISGRTKFITWLPDYTEIFGCQKIERTRRLMHGASHNRSTQVFDIQSYVKNKKRQKLEEMMSSRSESSPDKISFPFLHDGDERNLGENEFNIDDLIKEIDAKIEELEKEDEQEKEAE